MGKVILASAQAASNTGYITNNGSNGVVITLPTAPAIGDLVLVSGAGAWVLAPIGNQTIVRNMAGTSAVTGGGFSGSQGDSLAVQ